MHTFNHKLSPSLCSTGRTQTSATAKMWIKHQTATMLGYEENTNYLV